MNKLNEQAMVLLSGGQDSTTCLFLASKKYNRIHALSINYNQRHAEAELQAAQKVSELANVETFTVLTVFDLLRSSSPLTSDNHLDTYENYEAMAKQVGSKIEKTFVPLRNPTFLILAAAEALRRDCWNLYTGICQEDNANYPDCRENFRKSMEETINLAIGKSNQRFKVIAPLMNLTKAATIKVAKQMPECWNALAWTHTSYDGKYPPTGKNHSNLLRAEGFKNANLPDPLVIRAWREGLMELPNTSNYDVMRKDI